MYVSYRDGIASNEDVAMFEGGIVSWSEPRGLGLGHRPPVGPRSHHIQAPAT